MAQRAGFYPKYTNKRWYMKTFKEYTVEAKKFPKIDRDEYKKLLDVGHKITPASLYEPAHAPKGTKFVHAVLSPSVTRFVRIYPLKAK